LLQKQQVLIPFQFLLDKLSFVRITTLLGYHINIFVLKGIFICQISCVALIPLLTMCLYIELTVKIPFLFKFQRNRSLPSFKLTCTSRATRLYHSVNLSPTRDLRKETLSGFELSTSATVACFFRTMLNKFGYCTFSLWASNHLSFQNLVWLPLIGLNRPRFELVFYSH